MTTNHINFKYNKENFERARNYNKYKPEIIPPDEEKHNIGEETTEDAFDNDILKVVDINIQNFKGYNNINYKCNSFFNIIVGENNIGKSTIFDAFLLWEIAYKKLITSNSTFYKTESKNNFIAISSLELSIFRVIDVISIYNNPEEPCLISLSFEAKNYKKFKLGIEFEKPETYNNFIKINIDNFYEEFSNFHQYCQNIYKINIRDVFSIRLSQPIANIIRNEPFLYQAQLKNKSNSGYAFEVLRNKILNTAQEKKFTYLEDRLDNVLGKKFKIRWKNINKDNDVNINLTIQEDGGKEVDLALVGSGVINLLEIFSSLYIKKQKSNILLLDEPDSHIHSEIQSKLIEELRNTSEKSQIFIISHNDRLIYTSRLGELFYLNKRVKYNKILKPFPLEPDSISFIQKEMAGSLLSSENNYGDKPTLFVEGRTDKEIITAIIQKINPELLSKIAIRYDNGHSWVAKMLIAWHFFDYKSHAVGLFDYDEGADQSIKLVEAKTEYNQGKSNKPNFQIKKLKQAIPSHLKYFFDKGVNIPFAIEEMFEPAVWKYFDERDYLEKKEDIIKYNSKNYKDTDVTFKEFCKNNQIPEPNLIYLNKVKDDCKLKAASYIVEQIEKNNLIPFELSREIEKIISFLIGSVEMPKIKNKKVQVSITRTIKNKKYYFAQDDMEISYYLNSENLKKGSIEEWNNITVGDKVTILISEDCEYQNAIPAIEIYI